MGLRKVGERFLKSASFRNPLVGDESYRSGGLARAQSGEGLGPRRIVIVALLISEERVVPPADPPKTASAVRCPRSSAGLSGFPGSCPPSPGSTYRMSVLGGDRSVLNAVIIAEPTALNPARIRKFEYFEDTAFASGEKARELRNQRREKGLGSLFIGKAQDKSLFRV